MIKSAQRGFTLIELVVVIVILGILAAFAVPRFARLDVQARAASVRSLEGTLRAGATMARAQWLAAGQPAAGANMEGVNVAMTNGYPSTAAIQGVLAAGTIQNVPGRYQLNGPGVFELVGSTNRAQCRVTYVQPANANAAPAINALVGGC